MLYPDDEAARRAWIGRHWGGFYPDARRLGLTALSEDELIAHWSNAVTGGAGDDELRRQQGHLTGDVLKIVMALAVNAPSRASWNEAIKLKCWAGHSNRSDVYKARIIFDPAAHLSAAWVLRGHKIYENSSIEYTAITDLAAFLAEAESILRWGSQFVLARRKSEPILKADLAWRIPDGWVPPPEWLPITPHETWPRAGDVPHFALPPEWQARIGKKPPTRRGARKPVQPKPDK